jgi:hypothetical protein
MSPTQNQKLKLSAAENGIIIFDSVFGIFIFYVFYYDLFFQTRPLGGAQTISSPCQLTTGEGDGFPNLNPLGILFLSFTLCVNN